MHVIPCDKFQPCHWSLLAYVAFLALHVLRCVLLEIVLNTGSACVGRHGPRGGVLSPTGGTSGLSKYCNWQHTFLHMAKHLRIVLYCIVSRYFVWYRTVSIVFPYGCIVPSLNERLDLWWFRPSRELKESNFYNYKLYYFFISQESQVSTKKAKWLWLLWLSTYHVSLRSLQTTCIKLSRRRSTRHTPVLCAPTTNQAEWRSSAAYPWLGRSTRGQQPGGHMHKEAGHLLSLQPASITSSGAFKPECNGLSQFREDTGGPSMPVREFNLTACPLVQSSWKSPFQTWIWTQAGESHQPVGPAGTVAYSVA